MPKKTAVIVSGVKYDTIEEAARLADLNYDGLRLALYMGKGRFCGRRIMYAAEREEKSRKPSGLSGLDRLLQVPLTVVGRRPPLVRIRH